MKTLLFSLLLAFGLSAHAGEAVPVGEDPVIEQRMVKLAEDLRCLVCQNESLAGSHAELAEDLRREIRAQMKAGKNDKEVIDYLTERYGDFVLYRPPFKPVTYLLWLGPPAVPGPGRRGLVRHPEEAPRPQGNPGGRETARRRRPTAG